MMIIEKLKIVIKKNFAKLSEIKWNKGMESTVEYSRADQIRVEQIRSE